MMSARTLHNAFQKSTQKMRRLVRLSKQANAKRPSRPYSRAKLTHLMGMDFARFTALLPYRYVDDENQLFVNEGSLGFGCEVAPLVGANEDIIKTLSQLIKTRLNERVSVQVMLVGTPKVGPLLAQNLERFGAQDAALKMLGTSQYHYFAHAAAFGFPNKKGVPMPLRNYRCFIL